MSNLEGGKQIIAAPRPTHPLGKCSASVQLLAYIIVSKYANGLPLYRLEGILKRYGHEKILLKDDLNLRGITNSINALSLRGDWKISITEIVLSETSLPI